MKGRRNRARLKVHLILDPVSDSQPSLNVVPEGTVRLLDVVGFIAASAVRAAKLK